MGKGKIITICIWALIFILSIFFLLVIPSEYTDSIWVTLSFNTIAFISQLILWCVLFSKYKQRDTFYFYPTAIISSLYIIVECALCIITAFCAKLISFKVSLIINFIVMIIAWIVILITITSRDYIEKIDENQKQKGE